MDVSAAAPLATDQVAANERYYRTPSPDPSVEDQNTRPFTRTKETP